MDAIVLRMVILMSMLMLVLARYQVDNAVYPNDGEASSLLVKSEAKLKDEVFDRVFSNNGEASSSLLAKSKTNPDDGVSDRVFSNNGELSSSLAKDTNDEKEMVLPNSTIGNVGLVAKCTAKCSFHCIRHLFHYNNCFNNCFVDCEISNLPPLPPLPPTVD